MTREDVRVLFPDATEEQITAFLNKHNTELQTEKSKVDSNKAELDRLKKVEEELQAEKEKSLSAEQKLQLELDKAKAEQANYLRQTNRLAVENQLVTAGLTAEDYKDFIDSFVSEDSAKSKGAATAFVNMFNKQKEVIEKKTRETLLDGTNNPGGGNPGAGDSKHTEAEAVATQLAAQTAASNKAAKSTLDQYL